MGGLGRIRFQAISNYADRYGIAGESFDQFRTFLRAVDDEYVAFVTEEQKKAADNNT